MAGRGPDDPLVPRTLSSHLPAVSALPGLPNISDQGARSRGLGEISVCCPAPLFIGFETEHGYLCGNCFISPANIAARARVVHILCALSLHYTCSVTPLGTLGMEPMRMSLNKSPPRMSGPSTGDLLGSGSSSTKPHRAPWIS